MDNYGSVYQQLDDLNTKRAWMAPSNPEYAQLTSQIEGLNKQLQGFGQNDANSFWQQHGPATTPFPSMGSAYDAGTGPAPGTSYVPPPIQNSGGSGGLLGGTPQATPQTTPQSGTGMLSSMAPQQGNMGAYGPPNSQVALNSGFGSVQGVTDAMMARLQPQMDQARQTEISRLKAQGIPENSPAWSRAMDTLNRSDVDARNQGLLAGTAENNNIFNRGLAQNNQVYGQNLSNQQFANTSNNQAFNQNLQGRQQALTEQNNPYQQMMWMNSMQQGNPVFGNVTNAGAGSGTDYSTAGQNTYNGLLGNYNAQTAQNAAQIGGIGQLVGGIGSGLAGNPNAASNIVSNAKGLIGGIADAGKAIGGWFGP